MKVSQKIVVRWMSKLVATGAGHSARKQPEAILRELDAEQLRYVGGGNGSPSSLPNKGW